jgi:hypothetical protein
MLYKISEESIKKIADVHNTLNSLEVKGNQNVRILANAFGLIESVLQEIDKTNRIEEKPLVIDKGG